ncbi:putative nitroreductase [Neonectria magnoliae]|uniref:Nitroreductase n=1 Tax=Neonectria magnoliae TaxID=2732573 RepID=A0ABR1HTN2_9HYPO
MSAKFFEAIEARRSIYEINNTSPIPDDKIVEIVNKTIKHTPSAFNSQTTRVLVLLGGEHEKLWRDIVKPAVKAVAPAESWEESEQNLSAFQAGYGTVLFYEDPDVIASFQKQVPLFADKMHQWSEHANGMNTLVAWTALEQEGFGASLQHYNPLIDQKVSSTWEVPEHWLLKSQLVFGGRVGDPYPRDYEPLEKRVLVHGAK